MSNQSPVVFSCEHVLFGSIRNSEFHNTRYDLSGTIRDIDTARTTLVVSHAPGTKIPDYRWEHREIWFCTNNDRQFLEIEIFSPQEWQERPRFHLEKIHSNSLRWIHAVEHKLVVTDQWAPLNSREDELPEHTRHLRLTLKLPGHDLPTSFKLSVYAKDREHRRNINCDPLVGNEPP